MRWSTDGLRTESVTRDGNTVTVTCASFHLTSFAILVDVGGAQVMEKYTHTLLYYIFVHKLPLSLISWKMRLWELSHILAWPYLLPAYYSLSSSSSHMGTSTLKSLYCPIVAVCCLCFLNHSKKLFSAVHNFVHLNLAISLFIGYLVFAVGIELASHDKVSCIVCIGCERYMSQNH